MAPTPELETTTLAEPIPEDTEEWLIERSTCRHCRRPIERMSGWLVDVNEVRRPSGPSRWHHMDTYVFQCPR